MRLDEAFDSIMTKIEEKLSEATAEGGLLHEVKSIVRGDRARQQPLTPAIWIFAEPANPTDASTSIREVFSLPVVLTAIAQSDDPVEGYSKSSELAAKARSVVLKDKKLVSELRGTVQDTRSGRFEPSGPWHREGRLYGAVAVVNVIFIIKEW